MKKLFLIFMTSILTLTSLTSCSWLDTPANAKRIGSGYVQQENNALFVEVDGVKYSPSYIYTNGPSKKETTPPTEGMLVTLFTTHDTQTVKFIAGDLSQEYLEEYCAINLICGRFILIFVFAFITFCGFTLFKSIRND